MFREIKSPPTHYIEIEGLRTFISRNIVVYRRDDYVVSCMQKRRKTQAKKHLNLCKIGRVLFVRTPKEKKN